MARFHHPSAAAPPFCSHGPSSSLAASGWRFPNPTRRSPQVASSPASSPRSRRPCLQHRSQTSLAPAYVARLLRFGHWRLSVSPCTVDGGVQASLAARLSANTFPTFARSPAGPVCAPLVGAALVTAADLKWQWIYYLVIMMSGVVWVMIIVFVPETLYIPPAAATASTGTYAAGTCAGSDSDKDSNGEKDADFARTFTPSPNVAQETAITGGRRGAAWMPWHNPGLFLSLMVEPIKMIAYLPILLPSLYYAMLFGWSVGFTVISKWPGANFSGCKGTPKLNDRPLEPGLQLLRSLKNPLSTLQSE